MEEVYFWIIFLLFHFLFFLPHYFTTFQKSIFFPFIQINVKQTFSTRIRIRHLFIRGNQDFFRLNLDIIILTLFIIFLGSILPFKLSYFLLFIITFFGMVNQIYIAIILHVFKSTPSIKSDLSFLNVGFTVASSSKVTYLLLAPIGILLLIIFIGGISYCLLFIIQQVPVSSISTFVLICLLVPGFYKLLNFDYERLHRRSIFSPINHLYRNFQYSNETKKYANQTQEFFESKNQYNRIRLNKQPNIIIIPIESYGSILFTQSKFNTRFKPLLDVLEGKLADKNWKSTSIFSNAPIFSGRSWLSYTTLLYGIFFNRVDQFNMLFNPKSNFKYYKSLLSFFKDNGYKNYYLSGLGGYENGVVDFEHLSKIYTTDQFIKFEDISYSGKTFSFAGFGSTLPDQYTLNYGYHEVVAKSTQPFTLFFPTLNSHWKWDSPINVEPDWKTLNDKNYQFSGTMDQDWDQGERYFQAIKYQMNFLVDFIDNSLNDDDIIILFGDHQPPFISDESDGKATPIHIISKNEAFLNSFSKQGFEKGLQPKENSPIIKHEGFFSLFMPIFIEHFGEPNQQSFFYRPDGTSLKEEKE